LPDFRRGSAAMQAPDRNKSGGGFTPFCPEIKWTEDGEEKYVAFLTRVEEIPTVLIHEFVPVGEGVSNAGRKYTKYEKFLDRRDPAIGEDSDDLTDRLDHAPKRRQMASVVELEPTYTMVNNRRRPTGFSVKTTTFTRRTDDGEEEVTIPIVGIITQGFSNFMSWVESFNDSTAPIEETPLQIIRRGTGPETAYPITPFIEQAIDYTNLFDYGVNVGYLKDELEGKDFEGLEGALEVGGILLDKRLDELADPDRYAELVGPIQHIEDRFGSKQERARVSRPQASAKTEPASSNQERFEKLRARHAGN
jgi:hypothetical protein